jgi:hypothetical protein
LQFRGVQPGAHDGWPPAGCPAAWIPCGPQVVPKGAGKWPLLSVWADVGAAAGDGEDHALIAEDLDRPQYGVAANVMLLLELFHRWQRAVAPLTLGDPGPEDGC